MSRSFGRKHTTERGRMPSQVKTSRHKHQRSLKQYEAGLQTIYEGSPSQVDLEFRMLEREGEITCEIQSENEEDLAPEVEIEESDQTDLQDETGTVSEEPADDTSEHSLLDSEIILSDEDDPAEERPEQPFSRSNHAASCILDKGKYVFEGLNNYEADDDVFELTVICNAEKENDSPPAIQVPCNQWNSAKGLRKNGINAVEALNKRFMVLRAIGRWLCEKRVKFLTSCDLFCLGADAAEELKAGKVPVTQKGFLACLKPFCPHKSDHIDATQFGRFIKHVNLVFKTNQSGPLSVLFSDDAKAIWAACALWEGYPSFRSDLIKNTAATIDCCRAYKVPKKFEDKKLLNCEDGPLDALGKICSMADTSPGKVSDKLLILIEEKKR